MRRSLAGRRHRRPVALETPIGGDAGGGGDDDLSTWASTARIETSVLPGSVNDRFPAIVDVTNYLSTAAKADTGALRFRRADGVRIGHYKTASGRILIANEFHGGHNQIDYYWGKAEATQPGVGFPSATEIMEPYRLAMIFEGGAALDMSPNPVTFTIVGSPTVTTGLNGPAMQFAAGSYISTTAAKLTSDARTQRNIFVLTRLSDIYHARTICWANWPISQRAFQLWGRPDGLELFISSESTGGQSFETWSLLQPPRVGWNTMGASWKANVASAKLVLNGATVTTDFDRFEAVPNTIFNAAAPYIIGGTPVSGFDHTGLIECVFELQGEFVSENHLKVWSLAWLDANAFWGQEDRTPDNFDVPNLSNMPLNAEGSFAKKQITGITAGTPISVNGAGSPTYSIGSTSSIAADIKAKGSSDGTISAGNWLSSFHTTAPTYSTVTESNVTIGTIQSPRKSTTLVEPSTPPPSGGSGIPTGPATVTVTSLAALKTAIANGKGGDIIEIAEGDYKSQGSLAFSNKDLRGSSQPMVIRAAVRGFRGYLPTQGGLWKSGESKWETGSRGAEFNGGLFRNIHNIVFDGIRFYQGQSVGNWYAADFGGCSNLTFQYCKVSGYKPTTPESTWGPYSGPLKPYPNEWGTQGRGINLGRSLDRCDFITFKHCMFHYHGFLLDVANTTYVTIEDCVFTDSQADGLRNDGVQKGCTVKRCIFYRNFPQQGTGNDIEHPDAVQGTTKTQNGPVDHVYEGNIVSVGDGGHGKLQGFFLECDNWPQYLQGYNNRFSNNIMHSPTVNTIYVRPADRCTVEYCTILADMGAKQAPDSQQQINFNAAKSFANNVIYRCVTDTTATVSGDQITQSTRLLRSEYEAQLVHYPNSYLKAGFTPVRILNPYTGVINLTHVGYLAPKASSRIHPNQTGYHIGASQRFQDLGVLP